MAIFSKETYQKAEDGNKPFPAFKADQYIGTVNKVEVAQTEEKNWDAGVPTPTGNMEDVVKVTLALSNADGSPLQQLDVEATKKGEGKMVYKDAEANTIQYWLSPTKIYVSKKKGPTKGQKFLTSLLELLPDTQITLNMLEKWIEGDELMFKELKIQVDLTGENGVYKNSIAGFMPKK